MSPAENPPIVGTVPTAPATPWVDPTEPDPSDTGRRPPWRLAVALVLGGILWIGPYIGSISVLLPSRLDQVAPDQKVSLVATLSIVGSIVALVANVIFGALSDRTRSRFGRRAPWMVLGSVTTAVLLYTLTLVETPALIVLVWCVFQFFLNAIVGPIVAIVPDRVPGRMRGTYSAIYGVGVLIGASVANIVASRFVADPNAGFVIFAAAILLSGPAVALLAPDRSNRGEPRAALSSDTLLRTFSFPTRGARDFYLALVGKLLFVLSMFAVTGYQLYILTDYLGLDSAGAGAVIASMAIAQLVLSLIFGAVAGPLSDRVGRRKVFVVGSALLMGAAALIPFFWQASAAMIVFALLGMGAANGVFSSVDQALNYEVLPDPETAAKDLGILNMANTGGQILGPVVTSVVVSTLGGYRPVFLVSAVVAAIGAFLITRIRSAR